MRGVFPRVELPPPRIEKARLLALIPTTGAGPLMQQVNAPVNSIALPFASSTTVPSRTLLKPKGAPPLVSQAVVF